MRENETGIKWLVMPWQRLVASDFAVLSAVEESLVNSFDSTSIVHSCQFVRNVMLQDFPPEVFLQRPAIVSILQSLLEQRVIGQTTILIATIKTLCKLTRSLRYRISYYRDPSIANDGPKVMSERSEISWMHESSSDDRRTPEGGLQEANYQTYQQRRGTAGRESQDIIDTNEEEEEEGDKEEEEEEDDDSFLKKRQMLLPLYCVETLKNVLSLFFQRSLQGSQLKMIKNILELSSELVDLLIACLKPSVWFSDHEISNNINQSLKSLAVTTGEIFDYLESSIIQYHRIIYLHIACLVAKILSNVVPLEIADIVVPQNLQISLTRILTDAPVFLINRELHSILEQYARQFNNNESKQLLELFKETRSVTISLEATIALTNESFDVTRTCSETLKLMWTAKSSLCYHKRLSMVKKYVTFLQKVEMLLENDDKDIANKLILYLLVNSDEDVRKATYEECLGLISSALGVGARQIGKCTWVKVAFLLKSNVMTEIIYYGVAGDDKTIKSHAEDMLVYILKGKVHMGDEGWEKFVEDALLPTLGLLQSTVITSSQLGRCVTKMIHPDVYRSIQIPYIDVIKGNLRFLYSTDSRLRQEALCRLIFFLRQEKDSLKKLPRLSSLHGFPLSSLCVTERSPSGFKRSEGNYQASSLLSVLELIKTSDVEPKVRKSALVQISVMLTDICLHKLFLREDGLSLILDIMDKSLIEREYSNYPDNVIPLLAILKVLVTTQPHVRHDLSTKSDVYSNILRSLFLFPNNESVKIDASQLLCLLLYHEYIQISTTIHENEFNLVSLPRVIAMKMILPINCKSHWNTRARSEMNVPFVNNPRTLSFVRQFWYWERNTFNSSDDYFEIFHNTDKDNSLDLLKITDFELSKLRHTSVHHCANDQLINIQNSTMHSQVIEALDYLTMYLKLWKISGNEENAKKIKKLPWEKSFVRFLLSQPTNEEDCDLFVDVVNFLYVYINTLVNVDKDDWLCKIIRKNVTRTLCNLIGEINTDNQEIHEAILKLVRSASSIEIPPRTDSHFHEDSWISFIELIITNLCFGDQQQTSQQHEKQQQPQHFYNLAYLDWLLRCLTYLTCKCNWQNHKSLLISLGNALIELIVSFYGAGTVSFMGLSITRNSIICLNHLINKMQISFRKNEWIDFWYNENRNLSWLPMLWKNRDPLVRASAFQLLSALTRIEHKALQLLKGIALTPSDLCHTLLSYYVNREECCIVREQVCMVLANLVKNSNKSSFQYMDSLKSDVLITYIEQSNIYYEISVLCSNVYFDISLEPEQREINGIRSVNSENLEDDYDNCRRYVATPSLISITCTLLNNLIIIGGEDIAKCIYEQSLDKYFLGCFGPIPSYEGLVKRNLSQYCDILEMYISICTLMTNCINHCQQFAMVVNLSSETLCQLLKYLDKEIYHDVDEHVMYLRKSLITEVYNFLSTLSLAKNAQQHMEAIITSTKLSRPRKILISICQSMKDPHHELRMASIICLTSLMSHEIRKNSDEEFDNEREITNKLEITMSTILDNCLIASSDIIGDKDQEFHSILSNLNKITVNYSVNSMKSKFIGEQNEEEKIHLGSEISKILIHLFVVHNYAKTMKKNCNISRDREIIIGALSNLLCISRQAKRTALVEHLGETCLMILKEFHTKFDLQSYRIYNMKNNHETKVHPLLNETKRILDLLMNFIYNSAEIKERLAKSGLADCLHKFWPWISLDDSVVTSALELVATFTTNCIEGTHSLAMTNLIHGTGLRRSSNGTTLIQTIINLICREIDKSGSNFDNKKIHFAFHILRNAVHVHECRLTISKSNLLQLFGKINPACTKRANFWPLLEIYCLEFFNDFTFYEEGQVSIAKATDGLDVLIELARSNAPATRLLAISTLRNLVFNSSNRPRLLASAGFMNLLHSSFETGTFNEIGIAGSILWSFVSNSQKGKLMIRSADFSQSIQKVLGRLSLLNSTDDKQHPDLTKILHYVIKMLSSSEG